MSGEVLEVNAALTDAPETINQDCYGEGWMLRVRPSDPEKIETLHDSNAYAASVANRSD